jgi:hypothetical protein
MFVDLEKIMKIEVYEGVLLKKTFSDRTIGDVVRDVAIDFYLQVGRPIPNYKRLHLDIVPKLVGNKVSYLLNLEGKQFNLTVN